VLASPTLSSPDALDPDPDRSFAAESSVGHPPVLVESARDVEVVDVVGSVVVVVDAEVDVVVELASTVVVVAGVVVVDGHASVVVVVAPAMVVVVFDVVVVVLADVVDVEVLVVCAIAPAAVRAMARIATNTAKARNQPIPGSALGSCDEGAPAGRPSASARLLAITAWKVPRPGNSEGTPGCRNGERP